MLDKSFPFFIGVTKLIFQSKGKQPVEREQLNRYNNGEARTNLHLVKKTFDIISGPGLVLLVIKSNSFKISVRLIWHECKLTSAELFEEGDDA